jgi:hypothetical protein
MAKIRVSVPGLLTSLLVVFALFFTAMQILGNPWNHCPGIGESAEGQATRLKMVQSDSSKVGENDLSARLENSALDTVLPSFEASIKSCLGSGCFDERSVKDAATMRIGLLSPDMHGIDSLLDLIKAAGKKANLEKGRTLELNTHVPAYGYGKNHGWGRIVRFVTKIPEHSYALLAKQTTPTKDKYARQVKQFVRWHCRLNHVAAHTAMLSVFIEDLTARPVVELYKILSFMGIRPSQQDIEAAVEQLGASTMARLAENEVAVPQDLVSAAADALRETTARLSKWPCDSFKDLEVEGDKLPIHYTQLAADCNSEHVTCSVGVDQRGG